MFDYIIEDLAGNVKGIGGHGADKQTKGERQTMETT